MSPLPTLEDLRPLKEVAAKIGMSTRAAYRWRLNPHVPFRMWKAGRDWYTTESEAADFLRRRTEWAEARSRGVNAAILPAAPILDRQRLRAIAEADRRCKAAGW